MGKRILLAGVLGGIAMFIWSSVAHIVLPLGRTGVQEIPNEQPILSSLQSGLGGNSGFYMFPGMGLPANATREQQNAAMQQYGQKLAANPSGLLIYHPAGAQAMTARQLITEFLTELVESLIVVWLLAQTGMGSFASRVGFVFVAGIMAAMATNISYWNWYGFPSSYTEAYMFTQIVGYLCVGIVAGLVMKNAGAKSLTAKA